ncbi:MAG: hypothetical protein A2Z14_10985 [Chloroflexi bacterium RBG_16_48_8]|nr:MAG: hypothetical protein A2Z14_10985 [Chloroflexi bacterium RBG_16_48_8]
MLTFGIIIGLCSLATPLVATLNDFTTHTPESPTNTHTTPPEAVRPSETSTFTPVVLPPTSTSTAEPTRLPPYTYPVEFEPIPDEGDFLHPFDGEVQFETSISVLDSGNYLIYAGPEENALKYYSLTDDERGVLMKFGEEGKLPLGDMSGESDSLRINRQDWDGYARIFDLSLREAWKIGPLCNEVVSLSPSGNWLEANCIQLSDS